MWKTTSNGHRFQAPGVLDQLRFVLRIAAGFVKVKLLQGGCDLLSCGLLQQGSGACQLCESQDSASSAADWQEVETDSVVDSSPFRAVAMSTPVWARHTGGDARHTHCFYWVTMNTVLSLPPPSRLHSALTQVNVSERAAADLPAEPVPVAHSQLHGRPCLLSPSEMEPADWGHLSLCSPIYLGQRFSLSLSSLLVKHTRAISVPSDERDTADYAPPSFIVILPRYAQDGVRFWSLPPSPLPSSTPPLLYWGGRLTSRPPPAVTGRWLVTSRAQHQGAPFGRGALWEM